MSMKQPKGKRYIMGVALMVSLLGNAWQSIERKPRLDSRELAVLCQEPVVQQSVADFMGSVNNGLIRTWDQEVAMGSLLTQLSDGEKRLEAHGVDLAAVDRSQLLAWNTLHNFMQDVREMQGDYVRVQQGSMSQLDFYDKLTALANQSEDVAKLVRVLDGLVAFELYQRILLDFSTTLTNAANAGVFNEQMVRGSLRESSVGRQVLFQLETIKRLRTILEKQIADFLHAN